MNRTMHSVTCAAFVGTLSLARPAPANESYPEQARDRVGGVEASRLWASSVGAGVAVLSEGGGGIGFMVDAAVRPWGRSGIAARLEGASAGALFLQEGRRYESWLMTLGYNYQLPVSRPPFAITADFVFGPTFGSLHKAWSEGLCIDFDGGGCASSRPDGFEPSDHFVNGVGVAVSPNAHLGYAVLGLYLSVTTGLAGGEEFVHGQAGVRLGLSDS
jgi:hypothetical protein